MTDPPSSSAESPVSLSDFSRKLVANTLFNFLGRFWSFAATILLTPFILRHLSDTEFGAWVIFSVLLTSVMNAAGFLDLGLGSAFIKFISAYYTSRDYDRIGRVLFSGLVFYVPHGILFIVAGLALQRPLFSLFGLSQVPGAGAAYWYVLAACAVGNIGVMFASVFRGMQRMDRANALDMTLSLMNMAGTVIALELGGGLAGLALNGLVVASLYTVVAWYVVHRTLPQVSIAFHFDGKLLREMFGYGSQIVVSRIGSLACFQLDKLIVARLLGVASLKFYEVSVRMATLMRALPLLMLSALIPAASELGARNDKERIVRTYVMASKYVALVTIGLVAFFVLEADSILRLWLGTHFDPRSVLVIQILTIGYGVNVLGGAASQIGAGVGRPEFDLQSTIVLIVLSPILGIVLAREFGAPGAAAGTSLALIASAGYLLMVFHRRYLRTPVEGMFRDIHIRPLVSGMLAITAAAGFHHGLPVVDGLRQVWYLIPVKLALDFAVFSPVYVVSLMALRQITALDLENFMGLLSFGVEFLRHPVRERVKIYR